MREYETEVEHDVHALIAELAPVADWVIVEGFKHADLPKLEVWRDSVGGVPLYPADPYVVAVATDRPERLPEPTGLPVLSLDDPAAIAQWLMQSGSRHEYSAPFA
jgi:molybdopterin-guanine dinucleotide biosynthesis protein B